MNCISQKKNDSILYEFGTWIILDQYDDIELVLLKGHLMVEFTIDAILKNKSIKGLKKYSFYKKIKLLEQIQSKNIEKQKLIISYLTRINQIRNNLAHTFNFQIDQSSLSEIANEILMNFNGIKFTKYKRRTRIIHAFSFLSRNLYEIYI